MIFTLTTESGKVIKYDNMTNTLNPEPDFSYAKELVKPFVQHEYDKPDFDTQLTKTLPISHLRIQLGLKCNYKCSFCIQQTYADNDRFPTDDEISYVVDFVDKYTTKNCHIEFWGGEPLVYIKCLEALLPRLRKLRPHSKFSMITNGTLLTDHVIDILLSNRVNISISHDGPAYFLRGKDPIESRKIFDHWTFLRDEYSKANLSLMLNTVITQYNCDLIALDSWFDQHLPGFAYQYEGVVIAHSKNAIPFTSFTKDQYSLLDESIQRAVLTDQYPRITSALSHWIRLILRFISYRLDTRKISGKCDAAKPNVLSIDMHKNILSCHNVDSTQHIGSTSSVSELFYVDSKFKHWSLRPNCSSCFSLLSCRGNCMRLDDALHMQTCSIQKQFHQSLTKAAIALLYSEQIIHIK